MTYTHPLLAANFIPLARQSASKTSSNEVKDLSSRVGFAYAGICITGNPIFDTAIAVRFLRQKCLKLPAVARVLFAKIKPYRTA